VEFCFSLFPFFFFFFFLSYEMKGCYDNVSGCPSGFWRRTQSVGVALELGE
jgi:hypothetical protein